MTPTFAPAPRWRDIVALFGPRGTSAGCRCMRWRRSRKVPADDQPVWVISRLFVAGDWRNRGVSRAPRRAARPAVR